MPRSRTPFWWAMPFAVVLAELLVRIGLFVAELAWSPPSPSIGRSGRLRTARRVLERMSTTMGTHGDRIVATLTPERGSAKVRVDGATSRVVIECPWPDGGPRIAQRSPWDRLPAWLAPLRRFEDLDSVESSPRTLTVAGGIALADRLQELSRLVAGIAATSTRMREKLEARGLREGWRVELVLEGSRVVLRRPFASLARPSDSEHLTASLPSGASHIAIADGAIELSWTHAPTDDEIAAAEEALSALARESHAYR